MEILNKIQESDELIINGKQLTAEEIEIRDLKSAISHTEIVIGRGWHCDHEMHVKAIAKYKSRIEELEKCKKGAQT